MPRARPGYKPTSAETWTAHARAVSQYALDRLRGDLPAGLPVRGACNGIFLPFEVLEEAVAACAAAHDLGKLQLRWQMWASVAQKQRNPTYAHEAPLAHTDHDPESDDERVLRQALGIRRPPHASAGAYYSAFVLPSMLLLAKSAGLLEEVTSACIAAVLSHHGGWLTHESDLEVDYPCLGWTDCVASLGASVDSDLVTSALRRPGKKRQLDAVLSMTMSADTFSRWWPLVSYLCRTLRLSDQRTTAEGGSNE
ncbi:MAG: HD domain-containing protein [Bacillota bacterium]